MSEAGATVSGMTQLESVNAKRAKLDDVARLAGVSRTAASRAINGQPGTTDEVRQRVRAAADRLGFRPHAAARALAAGRPVANDRSPTIEILIVDPDADAFAAKPYYGRVVTGALRELTAADIALRLRVVPTPHIAVEPALARVLVNVPAPAAASLAGNNRLVSLGRSAPGVRFVQPDNEGGARQAVRHLVATGRTTIAAVLGPPDNPCAVERRAGFRDAMSTAGRSAILVAGDFTQATAYAATMRLLAENPAVDAVFAACDVTAIGVLKALTETGRRVPDDVAVVGFDGSALADAADLTSVYSPVESEAAIAVRTLLDPSTETAPLLTTHLVVRSTT